MAPRKWTKQPLDSEDGPKIRWFTEPASEGWTQPIIMEWELKGEAWTDLHVHDEYAYVLEGKLFVSCDGVTVEATAGEMVFVPAHRVGRYWAPEYARILGVYAPNPTGEPIQHANFEKLQKS
ncbi:MAG: cupin domain-containing protein [Hyphomicrobiaceae bacterium]|nr:cupin domain-containing protein [Hyphomicrobiaceae bacterium]